MKLGQKVFLKKSYAKWHLDHPEIYEYKGMVDPYYEDETLLHLMCCMGVPLVSKIVRISDHKPKTYLVMFKIGRLKMSYWVERSRLNA